MAVAFGFYCILVGWMFQAELSCLSTCYVDLSAMYGQMGTFAFSDTLLNTWILAWTQHGLATQPAQLFDANTFYPFSNTLSGSEHLLGLALLTWPLRLFTSNAIGIYQFTLVLTYLLLALTSYAFVRYVIRSEGLALLAGAASIFMPWHATEVLHIQLLGAHWFPLIWLLALRITLKEARKTDAPLLFLVLSLQLLTSFYLAYFISLSLALCIAMGMLAVAPERRLFRKLGLPIAGAVGIFLLSTIPYLSRAAGGQLEVAPEATGESLFALMSRSWGELLPLLETGWSQAADTYLSYSIPLAIALAALLSLGRLIPLRRPEAPAHLRLWTATGFLWAMTLSCLILMLGREAQVGESSISLPADWAASLVPGFANMRSSGRWAIPIEIAAPLLAAIGLHALSEWSARTSATRPRQALALLTYGTWVVLFLLTMPWRQFPAKTAYLASEASRAPYEELASLPAGAVMEFPWYTHPTYYVPRDSLYMAASTIHWKPIANGFTAYLPSDFKFLRRMASRLPDPEALAQIRRLVDVRWLVIHIDVLRYPDRARWRAAVQQEDGLRSVYDDGNTLILEVIRGPDTGLWQSSLGRGPERDQTLTGISRESLTSVMQRGQLRATGPSEVREPIAPDLGIPFSLHIRNGSKVTWPGLDPDTEGLVMIQSRWISEDQRTQGELLIPMDTDLAPGEKKKFEVKLPRLGTPGVYDLCFELVQIRDGKPTVIAIRPFPLKLNLLGTNDAKAAGKTKATSDFIRTSNSVCGGLGSVTHVYSGTHAS
jgi:hypothetical protein